MGARVRLIAQLLFAIVPIALSALWLFWQDNSASSTDINVNHVLSEAVRITSKSWEYGTLAEAMLELENPNLSVFSNDPFPYGQITVLTNPANITALRYVKDLIWTNGSDLLIGGEGSPSDPASLGIPALLLGQSDRRYTAAAQRQADYLVNAATRFQTNSSHATISHRDEPPQLWGDFVCMVPPFLAYYAAVKGDLAFLEQSVQQCQSYDEVLHTNITLANGSQCEGMWRHIVSQPAHLEPGVCCSDPDVWLTSNAWAVAGITRVLATLKKWNPPDDITFNRQSFADFVTEAERSLTRILRRILHCLMAQARDGQTGLLKNYLDGTQHSTAPYQFGDAAGTALVTSAVYRLMVILPEVFSAASYLAWADANYSAVAKCVGSKGTVSPVASVEGVPSKHKATQTSEGQSMTILVYAARRDCLRAGMCTY